MNTRGKNWLLWKGPTVCHLICVFRKLICKILKNWKNSELIFFFCLNFRIRCTVDCFRWMRWILVDLWSEKFLQIYQIDAWSRAWIVLENYLGYFPKQSRLCSQHQFDIFAEISHSINPHESNTFIESNPQSKNF